MENQRDQDVIAMFAKLTPENQLKVIAKVKELKSEQRKSQQNTQADKIHILS